jgi:excisionase family DNA binding protein
MRTQETPHRTQLLDYDEAAAFSRLSRMSLRRQVDAGNLPVVRIGRRVLFRLEDLEEFITARIEGASA